MAFSAQLALIQFIITAMGVALYVDSGNSLIKWGLSSGDGSWLEMGTCDEHSLKLLETPARSADAVYVASVSRGDRIEQLRQILVGKHVHEVVSQSKALGVRNGYAEPFRLGVDRWCAVVAAYLKYGSCIVITAGTAFTLNWMDHQGCFRGGIILPGTELMKSALAERTNLEWTGGTETEVPALHTNSAIEAGIALAFEGAFRLFSERCGIRPDSIPVVACGGEGERLSRMVPEARWESSLVLDGMRLLHPG